MPPAPRGRRQTLGVVTNTTRRRDSLGGNNNNTTNTKSGIPLPPGSSSKNISANDATHRVRKSRVSMIPRVQNGRDNTNLIPPSPGVTAQTASSRRKSVHGGGGGRRQTMDAPSPRHQTNLPPSNGMRADPRPSTDKAYQQECINKLLKFLQQNGYDYPISLKTLSRPSGRDFTNIVTFMLRQVDPCFQDFTGSAKDSIHMKLEDEVAMNFKALGYPYPISKTALVAAGSSHTWPTLLAALTWLMETLELLQLTTNVDKEIDIQQAKPFETIDELEVTTDKVFYTFMGKSYQAFLMGDESTIERLEQALVDRFEQDDNFIQEEIERVTDLNAAIVEKMNAMEEESTKLLEQTQKRDDFITDLEQFHDLIRQMDDHIAALNLKVNERSEDLVATNDKLDKLNSITDGLKQKIEKQTATLGDLYKIQSELKGVEEAMGRALTLKEKLRSSSWESEEQLKALFTELEDLVSFFNATLAEVALLPRTDEQRIASLKIMLDKTKALEKDPSQLLGTNLENTVNPTLNEHKEMYLAQSTDASKAHQEALDKLDTSKERLVELQEKLQILEARKLRLEETIENERTTQEAKLAVRLREVEAIESSVASINNPLALEEQLVRYEQRCAELEAIRLTQQEENLANKKAVEKEIEIASLAIIELDAFCKAKTAEVSQYWLMKKTSMNSLEKDQARIEKYS